MDLKIELRTLIESLSRDKLLLVYKYALSLENSPKGNSCGVCFEPLGNCRCVKEEV